MYKSLRSFVFLLLVVFGFSPAIFASEITAAHVNPPGEPSNIAFEELAKRLNEGTTGIDFKVFPQGQVGGEKDAIEQVQIGAITMTTVSTANLTAFAPSAGVFDIPFLFRDADSHPWAVVEGPVGEQVAQSIENEAGVEVLGWWSAGMRHLFTREKPVTTPADLSGQKIRVIGNPVYIDTFNTLGAQSTPMPYGEVYTGLATGAIDGAENDSSGYRNKKFYEQAPKLSLTGHFFLYKPVIANRDLLSSLSEEQRAEFDAVLAEVTAMQRQLFVETFKTDLEFLKEQGVEVIEPDRDAFIAAAQPVFDEYSEKFGKDLVQQIVDTQ